MIIAADLDSRVGMLENRVTDLDIRFERVMSKLDNFIEESRAARERQDADMREMREKHDADIREINEKHNADMREIRQSIEGMGRHVRNLTLTAMGGIVATGVGIAAIVVAVLLK